MRGLKLMRVPEKHIEFLFRLGDIVWYNTPLGEIIYNHVFIYTLNDFMKQTFLIAIIYL